MITCTSFSFLPLSWKSSPDLLSAHYCIIKNILLPLVGNWKYDYEIEFLCSFGIIGNTVSTLCSADIFPMWTYWPWRGDGPGTLLRRWIRRWPPGTLGWRRRRSCPTSPWKRGCRHSPARSWPSGQRRGETCSAARCCDSWLGWDKDARDERRGRMNDECWWS